MNADTNNEAYQTKDEIVVVRGESKRAGRIIGSQSDEQGNAVVSYYVRYADDAEPITEWVNPDDVMPPNAPNPNPDETATKKKAKK